eukprot:TRINITY_DN64947_c0_g1_i1.p2 TRINITY_DN64947_c0_g1~~TRINITY_DN64947_c0_g1_i1.p2  ORF type:complete len:101 (-),score=21.14 TRINITY_DN64947_c0_g1_i1:145-447(-)
MPLCIQQLLLFVAGFFLAALVGQSLAATASDQTCEEQCAVVAEEQQGAECLRLHAGFDFKVVMKMDDHEIFRLEKQKASCISTKKEHTERCIRRECRDEL